MLWLSLASTQSHSECPVGQFRCENGPCIDESLRCDGSINCPRDSSDELDCPLHFIGPTRYRKSVAVENNATDQITFL